MAFDDELTVVDPAMVKVTPFGFVFADAKKGGDKSCAATGAGVGAFTGAGAGTVTGAEAGTVTGAGAGTVTGGGLITLKVTVTGSPIVPWAAVALKGVATIV